VKDSRTLAMLAVLVLVVALGGAYLFVDPDDGSRGWLLPGAAVVLLLLIVALSAGSSRNRRVVRDEEEIDPEERRDG
jgi:drug/metabolite transporter (DMT)-like permease